MQKSLPHSASQSGFRCRTTQRLRSSPEQRCKGLSQVMSYPGEIDRGVHAEIPLGAMSLSASGDVAKDVALGLRSTMV